MSHRRCLLSVTRHPPAALGGPSRVKSSSAQIVFFAISKVLLGPNPCQRGPDPGKAAKKGDGVERLGTINLVIPCLSRKISRRSGSLIPKWDGSLARKELF